MNWTIAGSLQVERAVDRPDLLGEPVAKALEALADRELVGVAPIDPELADTAAFCETYGSPLEASANCVVVAGMFQINQCVTSYRPRPGCGSGSCSRMAKLWVPMGGFIHEIAGEVPAGALLHEYFSGSSAP